MTDVLAQMLSFAQRAMARVDPSRILNDPAYDFGNNIVHSLEVSPDELSAAAGAVCPGQRETGDQAMTSVRTERDGHVAHLILAAPARRNALTSEMAAELTAMCDELDADESVGAVIVRGEGGSFCSGADRAILSAVASDVMDSRAMANLRAIYSAFVRVGRLKPPTIAAIHGAAVGAGVNLAAATDLRVVAESARIIAGFQRIGLHPGGGHFALLGRAIGYQAVAALTVFGQEINGRRAADIGFAWAAVADDQVVATAVAIARVVAADPALARAVVHSARQEIGPPAISWELALEMEFGLQLWSLDRRRRYSNPSADEAP